MTHALVREVALLRDSGLKVIVLTPGPEDLAVMGGNLMDHRHREAVFETSMRTCAAALSGPRAPRPPLTGPQARVSARWAALRHCESVRHA
jgi:NTE family protein